MTPENVYWSSVEHTERQLCLLGKASYSKLRSFDNLNARQRSKVGIAVLEATTPQHFGLMQDEKTY